MSKDPIKDLMKDPDKKAKLFIVITVSRIVVTFMITIGMIIFILRLLGII